MQVQHVNCNKWNSAKIYEDDLTIANFQLYSPETFKAYAHTCFHAAHAGICRQAHPNTGVWIDAFSLKWNRTKLTALWLAFSFDNVPFTTQNFKVIKTFSLKTLSLGFEIVLQFH